MAKSSRPGNPPTEAAEVRYLDEQAVSWEGILKLRREVNKQARIEKDLSKAINGLQKEQAREVRNYSNTFTAVTAKQKQIKESTEKLREAQKKLASVMADAGAGRREKAQARQEVAAQQQILATQLEKQEKIKKRLADIEKTTGGALQKQLQESQQRKKGLEIERELVRDINKQRGFKEKALDLFRSKEERQRSIDIARAKAGGGANVLPAGAASASTGFLSRVVGLAGRVAPVVGAIVVGLKKVWSALAPIGKMIKDSLLGPLNEVSNLVGGGIGGGYGVGGGAISGAGATSMLTGIQQFASAIPFVGGLLGGLVGAFKGVVDLVLGLDQGITNFARNLGMSKTQARGIKEEFRQIAKNSDSIIVNDTRLMESQVELSKTLGIRSRLSADILENNIKLKEIAGLELETRKGIAEASITQNRNAQELTESVLAQTKAFEFQTGVAFDFRDTLKQVVKQTGVLGLMFTKNSKQLTDMYLRTKAMGFELKQLDSAASSFLDFESSISKEFEAQVLLGKEMNLTKAREAALNNDLATLAEEITKNVGNAAQFAKLNRIQQDAVAEAVGMTRDSLADVLQKQEYFGKLGARNLKQAQEELKLMKQRGMTQEEISKKIGEDAYNYITQTSTAERLAETMNKIKTVFVEFVEKSGILDFITNPQKIQAFAEGLINRLAGAVELVGDIIVGILNGIGSLNIFGIGTDEAKWKGLADRVQSGVSDFSGSMRKAANLLGSIDPSEGSTTQIKPSGAQAGTVKPIGAMNYGQAATPVGSAVIQNSTPPNANTNTVAAATTAKNTSTSPTAESIRQQGDVYLDGQKVGYVVLRQANTVYGLNV